MEPRVVWYGHRGEDAFDLVPLRNLAGIVCCDWSTELERIAEKIPVASLERSTGQRELWSSASLEDQVEPMERVLKALVRESDGPVWLLPYMATAPCERVLKQASGRIVLLAPPAAVVDRLSDKVHQRALFARFGLPSPESVAFPAASLAGNSGTASLPPFPTVVQRAKGSLGLSTFPASSVLDVQALARQFSGAEPLLVSRYIDGAAFNIHGVISPERVWVGWPSVMITGAPCVAPQGLPFAYCGNDFGSTMDLPALALEEGLTLAGRVGMALAAEGMSGMFGVDLLYDQRTWWVLEANCRLQGSTGLLTAIERRSGQAPLIDEHFRALGGQALWSSATRAIQPSALAGAQIVLYNRFRSEGVAVREPAPSSSGFESWVLKGAAVSGTVASGGAILGRLTTEARVLDSCRTMVDPDAVRAVEWAYGHLGVSRSM